MDSTIKAMETIIKNNYGGSLEASLKTLFQFQWLQLAIPKKAHLRLIVFQRQKCITIIGNIFAVNYKTKEHLRWSKSPDTADITKFAL